MKSLMFNTNLLLIPRRRNVYLTKSVSKNEYGNGGFEVFTAVTMNGIIIWDVTPCSLAEVNRNKVAWAS
jgi:hypothetical protein